MADAGSSAGPDTPGGRRTSWPRPPSGQGTGSWHGKAEGCAVAAIMTAGLLTPFRRGNRSHWGVSAQAAARRYLGDGHIDSFALVDDGAG